MPTSFGGIKGRQKKVAEHARAYVARYVSAIRNASVKRLSVLIKRASEREVLNFFSFLFLFEVRNIRALIAYNSCSAY